MRGAISMILLFLLIAPTAHSTGKWCPESLCEGRSSAGTIMQMFASGPPCDGSPQPQNPYPCDPDVR